MTQQSKGMPPPPSGSSATRMARQSLGGGVLGQQHPGTVQRRAPPGVKGDPRPVSDKGYQVRVFVGG